MEIEKAEKLAHELMEEHIGHGCYPWKFKWDNAKRRFGRCKSPFIREGMESHWRLNGDGRFWISLSKPLTELNSEAEVRDTILHEIAHALDVEERGTSNHDKNWKRIAISIGCNGDRCYGDEVTMPPKKWTVTCPSDDCDYTYGAIRRPSNVPACSRCCKKHNNGKYSREFILKLHKNF